MNRPVKAFSVGGVTVKLEGGTKATAQITEQVYVLLSRFFVLGSAVEQDGVHLHFHATPLSDENGQTVYQTKALSVRRTGSGFSLTCSTSQFQVLPGNTNAHCFLAPDFGTYSPFEQREFFLLGLLMLLRPLGRYGLHACGLERHGIGLLLVGSSGSGKTTTSLNLIREGWQYLSDDAVLLEARAESIQVSAFRQGFSCTPQTLEHFPELSGSQEFGDPDGKRIVYPDSLQNDTFGGFTATCTPSLVVFPRVTSEQKTYLQTLTPMQSLLRLCQQSAGIMTDTAVSQGQLELLRMLVGQAKSLELRLGQDALTDSALVDSLLNQALESRLEQPLEEPLCVSSSN